MARTSGSRTQAPATFCAAVARFRHLLPSEPALPRATAEVLVATPTSRRREQGKDSRAGMSGMRIPDAREARVPGGNRRGGSPMAESRTGGNTGGIGIGGILVIVGIVLMIVWSFWLGLIITLVGLIAFGGFAKGKWY